MHSDNATHASTRRILMSIIAAVISGFQVPAHAETLAGHCNPVGLTTCALPFPSDLFTEPDDQSPTGKRIVIPDDVLDLFGDETTEHPVPLHISLRPEALYAKSSGYSAAAPILFELASAVDEDSIPRDGGNLLQVYEIGGSGDAVPVEVGVMKPALTPGVARKDNVIEAFPRSRWRFGARYAAVLTRHLTPQRGGHFERSAGMRSIFEAPDGPLAQAHADALATVMPALTRQGMTEDDILSLTFFTVRDQAETITPLARLINSVNDQSHEFRGWTVSHQDGSSKAVTVSGEVRLRNYRDALGGMRFEDTGPGDDNWVDFLLTIPAAASQSPAPLVIYGHGIGADKESYYVVANVNARNGVATFAIDQPNHGTRSDADGGFIWDILHPEQLNRVVGMVSQSSLDMVTVVAAIRQHLGRLNTLPHNKGDVVFPWLGLQANDGVPDLDLSKIYYEGTSMGGVLGSAFLGMAPQLDGAYLQVAGTGIVNILTHSSLWSRFKHMAPEGTLGAELAAYLGMLTQALDYGDGINSIHHAREGTTILPYPYRPFPVALQIGHGDGIVFNKSSVALSELVRLPVALPDDVDSVRLMTAYEALPMQKLPADQWFDEQGYGVRMVQAPHLGIEENSFFDQVFGRLIDLGNSLVPHGSFFSPASQDYHAAWTERIILGSPTNKEQDTP